MTGPIDLSEVRKKSQEKHSERVKRLFEDHPEIADQALIIAPNFDLLLVPENMGNLKAIGMLELAKTTIILSEIQEEPEPE